MTTISGSPLLNRLRHMLVYDQPFAVDVFPDHGPAEISHLDFAGFCRHLFFDGSGAPDQIAMGMNLGVIVHGTLSTLVTGEDDLDAFFIFVPAAILQRSD